MDRLVDAVRGYASEAGMPMRFLMVCEVMAPSGPMLLHRGRDLMSDTGLQPWHEISFARASQLLAERDLLAWTVDPPGHGEDPGD